jgi:transcriptional regulator with XRE-family HTH domain
MPKRIAHKKPEVRKLTGSGRFIRKWRERDPRELSQEDLAELIGSSGASISRIESGDQPCTDDTADAIAHVLKIDKHSLLYRDPDDPETIWPYWDKANEAERKMLVGIAKTIIGQTGT